MRQCPKCNSSFPEDLNFCLLDGTPLADIEQAHDLTMNLYDIETAERNGPDLRTRKSMQWSRSSFSVDVDLREIEFHRDQIFRLVYPVSFKSVPSIQVKTYDENNIENISGDGIQLLQRSREFHLFRAAQMRGTVKTLRYDSTGNVVGGYIEPTGYAFRIVRFLIDGEFPSNLNRDELESQFVVEV